MSTDLAPELDSVYVEQTVGRLEARIRARFPDRRLGDAAHALRTAVPQIHDAFEASKTRRRRVRWAARVTSVVLVLVAVAAIALALRDPVLRGTDSSVDWLPIAESTVNDLVFTAIAVFFLWALPERMERRTLLDLLHRLRSLAHVIDMHQLDKDPEQARAAYHPTAQSPARPILDAEQLHHYLDYCSELVSLIAKTAALCAERTSDAVVLGTVSEIETLAAQMSQKIWQKISLLPSHD
ncbi:hypothetical protein [Oryzobacter telluris]|uniref:hypothetical protein n=1 Tax=Oryzobacter telluris TaxID=3149179 RepID=UPI00370D3C51